MTVRETPSPSWMKGRQASPIRNAPLAPYTKQVSRLSDTIFYFSSYSWIRDNPNFEHIEARFDYVPLGEYELGSEYFSYMPAAKKEAAHKMRVAFSQILNSFKPMLVLGGMDQDTADAWVQASIEELSHPETFPEGYVRWRYTTAIRKDTPFIARTDPSAPVDHSKLRIVVPKTSGAPFFSD
ncbi:hypothetical protein M407DRAFT_17200 [Tulasnella calospora MUT 4182]|uniref:Uncharacterized protein n=1 Tax=Tulasnella calospora MUT 4182 TaxID=1051891 RepID=A0A0C3LIV6_9AGAM|nr:hypothetical protein M407DRAFT_17200 [Tulasnella calospora MUT 4182]